ncbi:hypothetical protein V7S43_017265 [Phytophthora oleae]|uniref:Alcohol dehydrogenase-like N-terminal domain-containing protein n=1 Tax=Phytophthora oleae TaxID=2107226 RepID=A0ABD3ET56_9STRA
MDSGWSQTMYPCVEGHEIVCEVTLAGEQVKDVGVGAQVWACLNKFPDACKECAGTDAYYSCHRMGTYNSKYRKTDDAIIHPRDARVRVQDPGQHLVGRGRDAAVRRHDGLHAVQGGHGRRCRRGSANTEQEIRRLGADEFVVYTDD